MLLILKPLTQIVNITQLDICIRIKCECNSKASFNLIALKAYIKPLSIKQEVETCKWIKFLIYVEVYATVHTSISHWADVENSERAF